jgi:hypothetical protein
LTPVIAHQRCRLPELHAFAVIDPILSSSQYSGSRLLRVMVAWRPQYGRQKLDFIWGGLEAFLHDMK